MKLSDFDFYLPKELIAQYPVERRDHSDLMIVNKQQPLKKVKLYSIVDDLKSGDVLVLNNTKVIKAKLNLLKDNKKINCNLIECVENNIWKAFASPGRKLQEGDIFKFDQHQVIVRNKMITGEIILQFNLHSISIFDFLEKYGLMPLPPYIKRIDKEIIDEERYQTVYSDVSGSVAAPTAGLHFTEELLKKIKKMGVRIVSLTLHVGAGTFLPVKYEDITQHKMHNEYYEISQETAGIINDARISGNRVVAVGTTVLRALESNIKNKLIVPGKFTTQIFITPGFKFQVVDLLLTNFHLPKTTLFMLVCAFSGYEEMQLAYQYAIAEKMRFFSYGDACLLYKK